MPPSCMDDVLESRCAYAMVGTFTGPVPASSDENLHVLYSQLKPSVLLISLHSKWTNTDRTLGPGSWQPALQKFDISVFEEPL